MNGYEFKRSVEDIFTRARKTCLNITDDMLDANGAIYYMNGNDGTEFDWSCNGRLCEFYIFHKNEIGFIKVTVEKNNEVCVFIYEDAGMSPTNKYKEKLEDLKASDFANLMNRIADKEYMWDKNIDDLDWSIDSDDCNNVAEYDDTDW